MTLNKWIADALFSYSIGGNQNVGNNGAVQKKVRLRESRRNQRMADLSWR